MMQFPTAFEWSPRVLLLLAHECLTNRFGSFMCDSEKERLERVMPYTLSLWSELLRPEAREEMRNSAYVECAEPLRFSICQANFEVWEPYWFRYHPRGQRSARQPQASVPTPAVTPAQVSAAHGVAAAP